MTMNLRFSSLHIVQAPIGVTGKRPNFWGLKEKLQEVPGQIAFYGPPTGSNVGTLMFQTDEDAHNAEIKPLVDQFLRENEQATYRSTKNLPVWPEVLPSEFKPNLLAEPSANDGDALRKTG